MIQLAIAASQQYRGDVELTIFSPDTDVLVLAVANYHLLPGNTSLSMASSVIKIEPIYKAGVKREPRPCQLSITSQVQTPPDGLLDLVKQSGYRNTRRLMTTW